jgi:hypothetical protein
MALSLAVTIVDILLAIAFLGARSIKVIGTKTSIEMRDHVAVGAPLWRVIGALELAAAAGLVPGLFIPALGGRGCQGLPSMRDGQTSSLAGDSAIAVPNREKRQLRDDWISEKNPRSLTFSGRERLSESSVAHPTGHLTLSSVR